MLMKETYPDGSAKDHLDGVKDEHKAPDVMSDLIYTFTGSQSLIHRIIGSVRLKALLMFCSMMRHILIPMRIL